MRFIRILAAGALTAGLLAVPLAAAGVTPNVSISLTSIDFGSQLDPQDFTGTGTLTPVDGTSYPLTVTDTGSGDITLGTAGITGAQMTWFKVAPPDGCSGVTLHAGGSCTVTVVPSPLAAGAGSATFAISTTDSGTPLLTVALSAVGGNSPPVTADPGPGFVDVSWATIPVDSRGAPVSYVLERGTSPSSLSKIGSNPYPVSSGSFHDTQVTPGTVYYYAVEPVVNGAAEFTNPSVGAGPWQRGGAGSYLALPPARILDTRTTNGGHKAALGPRQVLDLQVDGRGGVPASGVSAVVLNLTGTGATAGLFLSAYPNGKARPSSSVLNLVKGQTRANLITVPIGNLGRINIYNSGGYVNVVADVVGFYADSDTPTSETNGGQFQSYLSPGRIADTRAPGQGGALPAGYALTIPLGYDPQLASHIHALAVNVTAVGGQTAGFLTAWSGQGTPPTSSVNYTHNSVVSNMAIVPIGTCAFDLPCAGQPAISILNSSSGSVHVVVDLFGFMDDDTLLFGARFKPLATPTRVVDTRQGFGIPHAIGPKANGLLDPGAIGDYQTYALDMNVTAVQPTSATFLTVWPAGLSFVTLPNTSNVNVAKGDVVPSHVMSAVGDANKVNIYNAGGSTNVVVDVSGTFEGWPIAGDPNLPAAQGSMAPAAVRAGASGARPHSTYRVSAGRPVRAPLN